MTSKQIQQKLIQAGVKNLKEFGYPECDETSILTDKVYSRFFLSMLDDHMGNSSEVQALKLKITKAKAEL